MLMLDSLEGEGLFPRLVSTVASKAAEKGAKK